MRTVKITHTGGVVTPGSASVKDSETGELIHGVSRVTIDLAIGEIAKAEVELVGLVFGVVFTVGAIVASTMWLLTLP